MRSNTALSLIIFIVLSSCTTLQSFLPQNKEETVVQKQQEEAVTQPEEQAPAVEKEKVTVNEPQEEHPQTVISEETRTTEKEAEKPIVKEEPEQTSYTLGWNGDHTFVSKGEGYTLAEAKLEAQKGVVQKFVAIRVKGLATPDDIQSTGVAVQNQFSDVIKAGEIVEQSKTGDGKIKILYKIEMENLKKRAYKLPPYNY